MMSDQFAMPAEWAEHSRCWMAWPSNPAIWTRGMDNAFQNFAHVVQAILQFEPVTLLVRPHDRAAAYRLCGEQVDYWEYSLDDSWMRDFGPTFVLNAQGDLAGVDWRFNGWGKYAHDNDQHVARFILERLGVRRIEAPFVLEGGSIHVDGEGTVLTTEQCLLHPNRNPELDKNAIEKLLLDYLGAQQVIWLPQGIADDDTDGHIDEIACFVAPGIVLALVANEKNDIDFAPLQRNADILRETRDARGRKLNVITLEQPEVIYRGEQRLSQSYINFYLANDGVVMPAFGDHRRDEQARGVIAELFPRRKVVQIPARELAYGGGNIHCITQQQPLARNLNPPNPPLIKGGIKYTKQESRMSKVTVAATQMACDWNRAGNIARAEKLVRSAAQQGAQIILLSELFETPYFCIDQNPQHFALATTLAENPAVEHFRTVARELCVVLPISFFERANNVYYNTTAVIDADGEVLGTYRKTHIPNGPGYQEKQFFHPGDTGFKVWDTRYARIGIGICWDQWFPETARALALLGAELIFYPTAIGSEPHDASIDSKDHWQRAMQGHAAANLVPVIASNRIGTESSKDDASWRITFYGSSFICDETGAMLHTADRVSEAVLVQSFDLASIRARRDAWGIFRDRRPECYGVLLSADGAQ